MADNFIFRRGNIVSDNGLFTFGTVYPELGKHSSFPKFIDHPDNVLSRDDVLSPDDVLSSDETSAASLSTPSMGWKVVTWVHSNILKAKERKLLARMSMLYLVILAVLALVAWLVARAVVAQKHADRLARESLLKFRQIFAYCPEAIVLLDKQGIVLDLNDRVFDWLGYRAEDCIGKDFLHLPFFPEESTAAAAEAFARRIQGDEITPYDLDFITKSGEKRVGRILDTPMTDETGVVTGSLIVVSDITDRKKYEEVIVAARMEAEAASRAKSEFLSSMSHELRTPLNAIIGFSEVLQEQYFGELNEKQLDYVNDVLTSSRHLLSLINDILNLSKVEAGKMELEPAPVGLKGLLEGSLVMIKEKAHRHGIKLSSVIPEDMTGLVFTADERKLKQVMYNLLSNAAKFTPDGGSITVEAQRAEEEITISVTDTGIGLSPDKQERVFDSFYQVSSGLVDKTAGTGLGLPLSQKFVELHGGRLWVESEGEGHGCRFSFSLPVD